MNIRNKKRFIATSLVLGISFFLSTISVLAYQTMRKPVEVVKKEIVTKEKILTRSVEKIITKVVTKEVPVIKWRTKHIKLKRKHTYSNPKKEYRPFVPPPTTFKVSGKCPLGVVREGSVICFN